MAKYHTQFDETNQTIGTNLAGWTVRGGGAIGYKPAYGDPATVPVKRRYLALTTATAGAVFTSLSWDRLDADANRADFDIVSCIIGPLMTVDNWHRVFARGAGGNPLTHAYFGGIDLSGNILIDKLVGGVSTVLGTAAITFDLAKSYFYRFRGIGSALKLRVWDAALGMAGEPAAWNVEVTDLSLAAAGPIGVSCYDIAGTGEVAPYNFLAVGTGGDSAVCPRTNTEYAAWLNSQSADRCVLAELNATGYESAASPFTKTVNVYIANHGFTSAAQDTPPNRHYDNYIQSIPTFSREMGVALSGQASVGFGDLIVSNPGVQVPTATGPVGVRDNWLRMSWNRNYLKMYLGDPAWPKHDFRLVVYGRLGMPTAPSMDTIRFPIADLADIFNAPLTTARFTSGTGPAYLNAYKPLFFGKNIASFYEPPKTNNTLREFTLHAAAVGVNITNAIYDNDVVLSVIKIVSAVNIATDTLSTAAAHGMVADYRVRFTSGTPPAPFAAAVNYYVIAAGLTTTDFRLSATVGGAAIDVTAANLGADFYGYGWRIDSATAVLTLAAPNVGKIYIQSLEPIYAFTSVRYDAAATYEEIIFSLLALSQNHKDASSFTQLLADDADGISLAFDATLHTASEVLARLATGTLTWYGLTPDGLLQVGKILLPLTTATMSFSESDIIANTLKLLDVIRPIDFSKGQVSAAPSYLQSQPTAPLAIFNNLGKEICTPHTYGAASVPLDNFPASLDANRNATFDLIRNFAGAIPTSLIDLYKVKLGVYEFKTRLPASQLSIGQTIQISHPRLGWKNWTTTDPASSDNIAAVDSTKAVVIGINTDFNTDTVTLKVFRRIPGSYPIADLN